MIGSRKSLLPDIIERSYAARLGVALTFTIIVMVVFGAIISMQAAATLEDDVKAEIVGNTEVQAESLESWVGQLERSAGMTASSEVVVTGDSTAVQERLDSLAERNQLPENVVGAHYIDTEGMTVEASSDDTVSSGDSLEGSGLEGELAERTVDDSFKATLVTVGDHERPMIAVVVPVDRADDRAIVYTADISAQKESTLQRDGTDTTVVSGAGQYIANPDPDLLGEETALEMSISDTDRTVAVIDDSGDDIVTAAGIGGTEWRVIAMTDSGAAFALSNQINSNLLGLLFLAVINLGLVGVTVGANTITSLRRLSGRAEEMAAGELDEELQSTRTDEIGRLYGSLDQMRRSLREKITAAETAKQEAENARLEAEQAREEAVEERKAVEEVNDELERKADEYRSVLSAVADGDFTARVSPESTNQSMVAIGKEINRTLDALEETIATTKLFATEVKQASNAAESDARAVGRASTAVRESTAAIQTDATTQREQLEQAAAQMQSLSATAEEVASSAEEVAETSTEASEIGKEGREAAEQAIAEMTEIETETTQAVEEIRALADDLQAIGDIVDLITEIVDQTNMLALNASIEAARADEGGDGFAVVADEIKNLAEETKDAAADIEGRIDRIQEQAGETVATMESTGERVLSGTETVEDAIKSLERILELAEEVDGGMQEIDTATGEQARTAQEVMMVIDDLNELSQQTESEAERVAGAADDQTESIESVANAAGDLNESAAALDAILEQFTVRVDGDLTESSAPIAGGAQ